MNTTTLDRKALVEAGILPRPDRDRSHDADFVPAAVLVAYHDRAVRNTARAY